MLTLTDQADDIIRNIPADYGSSTSAGLRIALGSDDGLQVHRAAQPRPLDEVLDFDGARLFLGPVAARRLDGKRLDARVDDRGRVQFHTSTPA
jgi:iron-sulfur cluster assembly protein